MTDKLIDFSGFNSVGEVAHNFGGISQMRDEYFELQREIQMTFKDKNYIMTIIYRGFVF